jgi:hypothetical protein
MGRAAQPFAYPATFDWRLMRVPTSLFCFVIIYRSQTHTQKT